MQLNNESTSELTKLKYYKIKVEELLDELRRKNDFIEELKNEYEQLLFELNDDARRCGGVENKK